MCTTCGLLQCRSPHLAQLNSTDGSQPTCHALLRVRHRLPDGHIDGLRRSGAGRKGWGQPNMRSMGVWSSSSTVQHSPTQCRGAGKRSSSTQPLSHKFNSIDRPYHPPTLCDSRGSRWHGHGRVVGPCRLVRDAQLRELLPRLRHRHWHCGGCHRVQHSKPVYVRPGTLAPAAS